jgi:hypothetical protein
MFTCSREVRGYAKFALVAGTVSGLSAGNTLATSYVTAHTSKKSNIVVKHF